MHYIKELKKLKYEIYSPEWEKYYGLHSNIPICCVIYYLTDWQMKSDKQKEIRNKKSDNCQYVRCDFCLHKKKYNKLHICTKKCFKKIGYGFYEEI